LRYHETVARSESLKSEARQAPGATAVIERAGVAPPVIHATVARALYATRLLNVTITNRVLEPTGVGGGWAFPKAVPWPPVRSTTLGTSKARLFRGIRDAPSS
ncbi:MAG TPA: hypothetical protein VKG38_19350, partial [Solirubrobacteraceae bacterium]|nr:hypothetical protein [Solirubrobacteraceae bacterium]